MRLLKVTAPDGHALGWISPKLIIAVRPMCRLIQYLDGDRIVDAYANADEVKRACGIKD